MTNKLGERISVVLVPVCCVMMFKRQKSSQDGTDELHLVIQSDRVRNADYNIS